MNGPTAVRRDDGTTYIAVVLLEQAFEEHDEVVLHVHVVLHEHAQEVQPRDDPAALHRRQATAAGHASERKAGILGGFRHAMAIG